jgi:hypothetical protein
LSEAACSFAAAIALRTDEFGDSFSGSGVASLVSLFGFSYFSTTTVGSSVFVASSFYSSFYSDLAGSAAGS